VEQRLNTTDALPIASLQEIADVALQHHYESDVFHRTLMKVFGNDFRMWNKPRVCNLQVLFDDFVNSLFAVKIPANSL
jgi:hypothetical protein